MFGMSLEQKLKKLGSIKKNRFELLYETNRKAFNYYVFKKQL
jgi:hypothetical protein